MSIIFGLISRSILIGLFAFFWLGIVNWANKLFQHQFSFEDFLNEQKYYLSQNTLKRLNDEINKQKNKQAITLRISNGGACGLSSAVILL